MKELSVFVDESGDFGLYDCHSPTYLFTMVFHDQKDDISQLIKAFIHELNQIDPTMVYFHAGPLIRREDDYKDMDILLRRRAFITEKLEILMMKKDR